MNVFLTIWIHVERYWNRTLIVTLIESPIYIYIYLCTRLTNWETVQSKEHVKVSRLPQTGLWCEHGAAAQVQAQRSLVCGGWRGEVSSQEPDCFLPWLRSTGLQGRPENSPRYVPYRIYFLFLIERWCQSYDSWCRVHLITRVCDQEIRCWKWTA